MPVVHPAFDGREYLLPSSTDPAWLVGGVFQLEWIVISGPDRGARYRDEAQITVTSDSIQALGGAYYSFPYQVRLVPLGGHGRWTPPIRTWLVQRVHVRTRGDTTSRFGLTIVDDVPRGFDGGGTFLTLTQLDTARFAAVWRSWHVFERRTWYGRRILEPSSGYLCALRVSSDGPAAQLRSGQPT